MEICNVVSCLPFKYNCLILCCLENIILSLFCVNIRLAFITILSSLIIVSLMSITMFVAWRKRPIQELASDMKTGTTEALVMLHACSAKNASHLYLSQQLVKVP